jgi:hypothetical protein
MLLSGLCEPTRVTGLNNSVEACRQIVKHDDVFAGISQFMDHVTADIASAASYKDGHRSRARRGLPHSDS